MMDTATAKELLKSTDVAKLRECAVSLEDYQTNNAADEEQILKLQILLWNRILQLQGPTSPESADALVQLGSVWMRMGENERASGQFQKALSLQTQSGGGEKKAQTLQMLGQASVNCSNYEKAAEYHTRAIAELVDSNVHHTALALAYTQLAGIYEAQSDFSTALDWLDKASEAYQQAADKNDHIEILATIEAQRGTLQEKLGEYSSAVSSLLIAHAALMESKGADDPRTQEISFLLDMAKTMAE